MEREHVVNVGEFRAVPELIFPYETKLKKMIALDARFLESHSTNYSRNLNEVINSSNYTSSMLVIKLIVFEERKSDKLSNE